MTVKKLGNPAKFTKGTRQAATFHHADGKAPRPKTSNASKLGQMSTMHKLGTGSRLVAARIAKNNPRNATQMVSAEITAVDLVNHTVTVLSSGVSIPNVAVLDHVNLNNAVGKGLWINDMGKGRWLGQGVIGNDEDQPQVVKPSTGAAIDVTAPDVFTPGIRVRSVGDVPHMEFRSVSGSDRFGYIQSDTNKVVMIAAAGSYVAFGDDGGATWMKLDATSADVQISTTRDFKVTNGASNIFLVKAATESLLVGNGQRFEYGASNVVRFTNTGFTRFSINASGETEQSGSLFVNAAYGSAHDLLNLSNGAVVRFKVDKDGFVTRRLPRLRQSRVAQTITNGTTTALTATATTIEDTNMIGGSSGITVSAGVYTVPDDGTYAVFVSLQTNVSMASNCQLAMLSSGRNTRHQMTSNTNGGATWIGFLPAGGDITPTFVNNTGASIDVTVAALEITKIA